jgi:hypothetical protein
MGVTIRAMLDKVKSLNLTSQVPKIIQQTSGYAIKLNQSQLYEHGEDSTNKNLKYSSPSYAINKNRINPSPGLFNADLFVTGKFYKGFYAQVKGGTSILFGSTDFKSLDLEKKFGNKIFGLTMDNQKIYAVDIVYPELQKYITSKTGLQFT